MYKKILVCLDNSDEACAGVDLAVNIAAETGAELTGCHVYAAKLHNMRFIQMEDGLPEEYQKEEELKRQREIHDSLITKGLQIISDSYMTVLEARASNYGLETRSVSREGKNFDEIVKEAEEGGYDLVVLGSLGLGKVGTSRIGSVCERVVRRLSSTDVLVVRKGPDHMDNRRITVAVDGSPSSFAALKSAMGLSKVLGCELEAVSAFDPDYHYAAFRSIAGVLSEEAGKIFRFKEQEKLHEEIIDKGLAKIYQDHLDRAKAYAEKEGFSISTKLLSGKPFDKIIRHVEDTKPFMLFMGRTGVHAVEGLDIGSNTENCLRETGCNVYISGRTFMPEISAEENKKPVRWSKGALDILEKVPSFARGIVKNMVEDAARKEGFEEITPQYMHEVKKRMGH